MKEKHDAFPGKEAEAWLLALGEKGPFQKLLGGASPRLFWRLLGREKIFILSPKVGLREHGAKEDVTWPMMNAYLAGLQVPVPKIYGLDEEKGFMLVEDLGDERLFERVRNAPEERMGWYHKAIDLLIHFQTESLKSPPNFQLPKFQESQMLAELQEFQDMALVSHLGLSLGEKEKELFQDLGATFVAELQPKHLAHRDFQSQNLMLKDERLCLIDFQDAFWASESYDLVALLFDSYVSLKREERASLIRYYTEKKGISHESFRKNFYLQALQRKMKDAGRFETLRQRGKPQFMAYMDLSLAYLKIILSELGRFQELQLFLEESLP